MTDTPVPKGWVASSIAEIADVNPPRIAPSCAPDAPINFVPMAAVTEEFGGIDLSAKRPFSEVQKGYTQFREGDVIVAKITPCMENGKLAIVPPLDSEVGYGSTEFHVLRAKSGVSPDWIAHFVAQSGFRREAQRNMSGSAGQLRVPAGWLEEQPIPVAPREEQTRITAKIEELFSDLDASVAALERARANLKRYRAAVLKAAVEGRLTEAWRKAHSRTEPAGKLLARILAERRKKWEAAQLAKFAAQGKAPPKGWKDKYPEPAQPDTTNLPELPEGWCWATYDQVSTLITKGSSPNWQGFEYCNEGVTFVRSENVRWGNLDLTDVAHLPIAFNEKERKSILRCGDVLLNLVGASIGRAAIATQEVDGGNVNQAVAVIRLVEGGVINQFAMLWLISSHGQRRIHAEKVDVARANFSLDDTRMLPVPLPPVTEQQQIVSEIERHISLVGAQEKSLMLGLDRSKRLRQSILKRAFEGKLVPQDPNDEPASALLARIRAARAEDAAKPKPAGKRSRPAQR